MSIKPTVALVLPESISTQMFTAASLARLSEHATVVGPLLPDAPGFTESVKPARVVLGGWGTPHFGAELLKLFPHLEFFAYSAGSVKGVVSDALYGRGIQVTTSASGNATPVAEFTVAMMQALLKQVFWLAPMMSAGNRAWGDRFEQVRELCDIDVGLVGASRIGREVVRLLKAFKHLRVKLYDPFLTPQQAEALGVQLCSLDEVCACEVVSVHAPNIPQTRHMLNARTLARLPDHAVFINTSRGALVDETALIAEVKRRPIYVLLDVTDPEPPAKDSELRTLENIILTPHIAGAMKQARHEMGRIAIDEVIRFLAGQPLSDPITREMLATQA